MAANRCFTRSKFDMAGSRRHWVAGIRISMKQRRILLVAPLEEYLLGKLASTGELPTQTSPKLQRFVGELLKKHGIKSSPIVTNRQIVRPVFQKLKSKRRP